MEYESLDHQLALIDGRCEKVPQGKSGKRKPINPEDEFDEEDLTEAQLRSILAKMGAIEPEPEVEEPDDETS